MAVVSSAVRSVKAIGHQDRLTLIEHLDELRTRLIFCVATLVVVFAVCLWQNDALLNILNKPLAQTTAASIKKGEGLPGQIDKNRVALLNLAKANMAIATTLASPASNLPAATRAQLAAQAAAIQKDIASVPKQTEGNKPVTLRVGEPFSTSLLVSLYFALLFSLPILLYQLYAFVLPAFTPREKRVAVPLMGMVPVLFISGVVFGYFVVLPPAVQFLQNFNADQFNILVQASDYYKFAVLALISLGVLFQLPVGILAAVKMGIVTPKQLAKNRRYALLAIAVVAMLLPGTDPVTMLISMVPLIVLYEFSIVLARIFGKPKPDDPEDTVDAVDVDALLADEEPVPVPVGADWDEGEGGASIEDDDWHERPPRRDSGGTAPYPEAMLFDLRGRGRRRTVQVIYGGLAILIGGGLVFFGIGGAGGGFFSDAQNGASSDVTQTFQNRVKSAEKRTQANPKDAAAWAALAKAQYQIAGVGDNFDQSTSTFTPKGKVQLAKVNAAWQRYLSLDPAHPDSQVASLMVQAYGPSGLNKPDDAVTAFETYQTGRPASATLYGQLALYALAAGQTRKADLAEKKALSLATSATEKQQIKQNIAQAKQQLAQDAATAAQQSSGAASGSGGTSLSP